MTRVGRSSTWVTAAAALALVCVWSWIRPTTEPVMSASSGELVLDYTGTPHNAPADETPVAGDMPTRVVFGDTVFLALCDTIDVSVTWTGAASAPTELVMWPELSSSAGWHHVLGSERHHRIVDGRTVTLRIDLIGARRAADRLDALTGTSGTVTVSLVAEVRRGTPPTGDTAGDTAGDTVAHAVLSFGLTSSAAVPDSPPVSGGAGPRVSPTAVDRVRVDEAGGAREVPARLTIGSRSLDRSTLRTAVTLAAAGATAGVTATGLRERRLRRRDPARLALARHGRRAVWAQSVSSPGASVVALRHIDDLVRIAVDLDLPITAERTDDSVVHRIVDGPTVYLVTTPDGSRS